MKIFLSDMKWTSNMYAYLCHMSLSLHILNDNDICQLSCCIEMILTPENDIGMLRKHLKSKVNVDKHWIDNKKWICVGAGNKLTFAIMTKISISACRTLCAFIIVFTSANSTVWTWLTDTALMMTFTFWKRFQKSRQIITNQNLKKETYLFHILGGCKTHAYNAHIFHHQRYPYKDISHLIFHKWDLWFQFFGSHTLKYKTWICLEILMTFLNSFHLPSQFCPENPLLHIEQVLPW